MSGNFDLFGDPVPEGWGKRGRPPHVVTDEKRSKVMLLLAVGRVQAEIAAALGITEPTLRKNYFRELRSRTEARFRVEGVKLLRLYEQVDKGNVSAMKEMRKILDRAALDDLGDQFRARAPKKEKKQKLGKKVEAALEAAKPPDDKEWADLVGKPH